ncbi:NUDIX hydrolase [Halalkalibacter alkalisediminis]|uniref:NUDIX hydrolase n=1 Tax=Halalkalibacter alkalisediminis TaxID=935616 RepID=A0ABV6NM94_9BACI|nr:CoA pyrophosphatase [Halalkalibacter alkalisediminis]
MYNLSYIQKQLSNRKAGILGSSDSMKSAVVLPLVYVDQEISILFEVRSKTLTKQPGEICFPGGKIDSTDVNPEAAAVRELHEEIGILTSKVEIVSPLDILVTPFRGIIYPFVGTIENFEDIKINRNEVDHVFTVPLSFFRHYQPQQHTMRMKFEPVEGFPLEKIANKRAYKNRYSDFSESFYYYEDYVIWGLTARILTHFLEIMKH